MVFEANIPLYIQISNDILSKIEGGEFKNMLPSEMELVNLYNVSRVTNRFTNFKRIPFRIFIRLFNI